MNAPTPQELMAAEERAAELPDVPVQDNPHLTEEQRQAVLDVRDDPDADVGLAEEPGENVEGTPIEIGTGEGGPERLLVLEFGHDGPTDEVWMKAHGLIRSAQAKGFTLLDGQVSDIGAIDFGDEA